MNKIKYASHALWSATPHSKLTFRYRPKSESLIHSLVLEVIEMYSRFKITMYKSNGDHFYRVYADKQTALKYIADWMKYYKKNTEESFENTEVDMYKLMKKSQDKKESPRLSHRLSLNLSPRRLSRSSSSPRTPRTPNSEQLSRKHKPSPRLRDLLSPRSRSADTSPREDETSLESPTVKFADTE
jgi:hypothetical protein